MGICYSRTQVECSMKVHSEFVMLPNHLIIRKENLIQVRYTVNPGDGCTVAHFVVTYKDERNIIQYTSYPDNKPHRQQFNELTQALIGSSL